MSKKRKAAENLELEQSIYSSFVAAANSVSQLYTQGIQQQRRAAAAASKATLEKVVAFVLRENEGSDHVSKAALLQFVQHEYENADSCDIMAAHQLQQFMPFASSAAAAAAAAAAAGGGGGGGDGSSSDDAPDAHKAQRQYSGSMLVSPAARSSSASRLACLEEQQRQQQQLHMQQQHFHQQQQQHLAHQQHHHQQQQQQGQQPGDPMQVAGGLMQMAGPFTGQPSSMHQHGLGGQPGYMPGGCGGGAGMH